MLYIVSTPIGNLEDITFRAVRILHEVDLLVAEDTRHVRKLLDHYKIKTKVDSYHSYSDDRKLHKILNLLEEGKNIALVSDAGTPCVSDPGFRLVQKSIEKNIQICPIPGPSAVLAALVCSGLPMDEFEFFGFLPVKKGRQTMLKKLQDERRTMVFYESPHRLLKTLDEFNQAFGADRKIVVAREMTKIYEQFLRGTLLEILDHFKQNSPRGEFVLIVAGA